MLAVRSKQITEMETRLDRVLGKYYQADRAAQAMTVMDHAHQEDQLNKAETKANRAEVDQSGRTSVRRMMDWALTFRKELAEWDKGIVNHLKTSSDMDAEDQADVDHTHAMAQEAVVKNYRTRGAHEAYGNIQFGEHSLQGREPAIGPGRSLPPVPERATADYGRRTHRESLSTLASTLTHQSGRSHHRRSHRRRRNRSRSWSREQSRSRSRSPSTTSGESYRRRKPMGIPWLDASKNDETTASAVVLWWGSSRHITKGWREPFPLVPVTFMPEYRLNGQAGKLGSTPRSRRHQLGARPYWRIAPTNRVS